MATKSYAIRRHATFGPTFGAGYDIHLANNANNNTNSYANFGYNKFYPVPNGTQNRQTLLAGTVHFKPDDWEVFYLS